jgi:hypothetical protein
MSFNNVARLVRARTAIALALAWVLLGAASTAAAQECKGSAAVTRETPVYAQPATAFNTASGWVYGQRVAVLGARVKVFICSERTVRFGLISQGWTQIAYWDGKRWQHGWVVSDSIQASIDQPWTWLASLAELSFIPSAHAQTRVITENPPANASAAPPPPESSSGAGAANSDGSAVGSFYGVLFACMILGMLAKIAFDTLTDQKPLNVKARARAGFLPFLVSPIVFLGIMQGADANQALTLVSFIAVACSAFQNGFFWHAILDRGH